jgi:hypothetical protein
MKKADSAKSSSAIKRSREKLDAPVQASLIERHLIRRSQKLLRIVGELIGRQTLAFYCSPIGRYPAPSRRSLFSLVLLTSLHLSTTRLQ